MSAGRTLVGEFDRLLPDVHAWECLRRAALRRRGGRAWIARRRVCGRRFPQLASLALGERSPPWAALHRSDDRPRSDWECSGSVGADREFIHPVPDGVMMELTSADERT